MNTQRHLSYLFRFCSRFALDATAGVVAAAAVVVGRNENSTGYNFVPFSLYTSTSAPFDVSRNGPKLPKAAIACSVCWPSFERSLQRCFDWQCSVSETTQIGHS